jgi:hypothetical protein
MRSKISPALESRDSLHIEDYRVMHLDRKCEMDFVTLKGSGSCTFGIHFGPEIWKEELQPAQTDIDVLIVMGM